MGRSMGINRARVEPPDAREIKRTADRYLHAQHFLLRLYSHKNEITADQLHDLRRQAISGDIEGAAKGLFDAIGG